MRILLKILNPLKSQRYQNEKAETENLPVVAGRPVSFFVLS